MKFYETRQFKELQREWREKLKNSDFHDLEDSKERLKSEDRRTIGFENREAIRDFFTEIGHLLAHCKDIPNRDRRVLELWTEGNWISEIAEKTGLSTRTVKRITKKYKEKILSLSHFPQK